MPSILFTAFHTAQRTLGSWRLPTLRWSRQHLPFVASASVFALVLVSSLAPPRLPTQYEEYQAYLDRNAQTLSIPATVTATTVVRDGYSATPGIATLAAGGTNYDWAKLVMMFAGFPMSESNITVFTRWMRQENGPDDWWNRNNPLNNGWGSGGGGGLGSYDTLVTAAQNAAEALTTFSGYREIAAGFRASAPTEVIEAAIWASPWASANYGFGARWSYVPVPVVKSPDGTWG